MQLHYESSLRSSAVDPGMTLMIQMEEILTDRNAHSCTCPTPSSTSNTERVNLLSAHCTITHDKIIQRARVIKPALVQIDFSLRLMKAKCLGSCCHAIDSDYRKGKIRTSKQLYSRTHALSQDQKH